MKRSGHHRSTRRHFISFFSGALGLDLGLEAAGLDALAVNEFDPSACATIRRNKSGVLLYSCDIRRLTAKQLMLDLGLDQGELFAVAGGVASDTSQASRSEIPARLIP